MPVAPATTKHATDASRGWRSMDSYMFLTLASILLLVASNATPTTQRDLSQHLRARLRLRNDPRGERRARDDGVAVGQFLRRRRCGMDAHECRRVVGGQRRHRVHLSPIGALRDLERQLDRTVLV